MPSAERGPAGPVLSSVYSFEHGLSGALHKHYINSSSFEIHHFRRDTTHWRFGFRDFKCQAFAMCRGDTASGRSRFLEFICKQEQLPRNTYDQDLGGLPSSKNRTVRVKSGASAFVPCRLGIYVSPQNSYIETKPPCGMDSIKKRDLRELVRSGELSFPEWNWCPNTEGLRESGSAFPWPPREDE